MSIFKRLSATMFSGVDRVVSEIENHDAIVESSIRDHRKALARARVRFNRLRGDGQRLAQRLEELQQDEARWGRRAADQADRDEQTALKCLQKRRDCRRQISGVEKALAEHRGAETRLAGELQTMEERIKQIGHKKNLLRTRQSTAEAMRTFKAIEDCTHIDIEDTFEKWETRVMEAEMASGDFSTTDDLEQQFLDAETLDDLKEELSELTRGERQ